MLLRTAICVALSLAAMSQFATAQETTPPKPSQAMAAPATPDADMQMVLDTLQALGGKPIETLTPAEARVQPTPADAVTALLKKQGATLPKPAVKIANGTYPTAGGTQQLKIYTPTPTDVPPAPGAAGAMPVIVYFHGGGWVIADIKTYESSALALAEKAKAIVVSVEYRHAPEFKFPAAHEDAFVAYQWVLKNAASFNGDPKRVAVAGESAGANLAANVSIMARDQKVALPIHQVLVYPVAGSDMNTPSYKENANAKPLNKAMMAWFVKQALTPEDAKSPMINLVAANLAGLPPTTLITAQIDPLRSEGSLLADKLSAAGVKTTYKNYDGVTHEFFGMGAVVKDAAAAQDAAAGDLRKAFTPAAKM
ncbi:MAG: alpha/beta hydrolase fold domain-containing protein [Steroidobacteraceae bacterium]